MKGGKRPYREHKERMTSYSDSEGEFHPIPAQSEGGYTAFTYVSGAVFGMRDTQGTL